MPKRIISEITWKSKNTDRNPTLPKLGHVGSSALSMLALAEHLHAVTGMPEIRVNDPILPLLTKYVDECLAYRQTLPATVPPENWDSESDDYESWVEVEPGHPGYPDPDTPAIEGSLSRRETVCCAVWAKFVFGVQILQGIAQYLPEVANPDPPEGMAEVSEEAIDKVMRGLLSIPTELLQSAIDCSVAEFWAATHWAFKESNCWPSRLKTLDDVIRFYPEIYKQYERHYAKLPEGKKPHDLGVGKPKRARADSGNAIGEPQ